MKLSSYTVLGSILKIETHSSNMPVSTVVNTQLQNSKPWWPVCQQTAPWCYTFEQLSLLFIFGCLQHWCMLLCSVTWLPSSSVCTRDDPCIRPNGAIWRTFLLYIRSQRKCSRGCRTTSRPCGHWTMASTFMRWVRCILWLHQLTYALTLFCFHHSCLLWCWHHIF